MAAFGTYGSGSVGRPIIVDGRALQFFLVAATIALLPLNWLLGTTVPWIFLTAGLLAFGFVRFSLPEWQILALTIALALSMLLAMISDFEAQRALAAMYNLSVLLMILVFINFGRQIDHAPREAGGAWPKDRIYRAAFWAYLSYVAFMAGVTAYVTVTGDHHIVFDALVMGLLPKLPGVLGMYVENVVILGTDWVNGHAQPRIFGMGVYATESAVHIVILAAMAAIYLIRKRHYFWAVAVELSVLPMLIPIGSRTTGLAYIVSLVFMAAVWRGGLTLGAILLGPFAIAGLVLFAPDIVAGLQSAFQGLAEARAGSTETRMETYRLAISMVLDQNLLIGLGIKPVNPALAEIPIGSHSSFVSTFTRGGLIGLGLFVAFYVTMMLRLGIVQLAALARSAIVTVEARLELAYLARAIFVFLLWCVTEDLDAPLYSAMLAGLAIGIFWNMGERLRRI